MTDPPCPALLSTAAGRITLTPTTEQTALVEGVTPGMQLLLDDGFMEVTVKERLSPTCVTVEVVVGGNLKSRKGINVPELQIDCSALTVKDREDAAYLLSMGVDYIALSFAQKKEDIQELLDLMDAEGVAPDQRPAIIPKIEKPGIHAGELQPRTGAQPLPLSRPFGSPLSL